MKDSSRLNWSKKQRAALHGYRFVHRYNVLPHDRRAISWATIREWVAANESEMLRSHDATLSAALTSVQGQSEPPAELDPLNEMLRVRLAEWGVEVSKQHRWQIPSFGPSFAEWWGSNDLVAALTLCGNPTDVELLRDGSVIDRVEHTKKSWIEYPFGLGGRSLECGYDYFGALRRMVFELDESTFASVFERATLLRNTILESDYSDRMTMLYVLAYVFSREGAWAFEHVVDLLETPKYADFRGWDLLIPALTDPTAAIEVLKVHPNWVELYCHNLSGVFDIVESFGSDAENVLKAISVYGLKPRVQKAIEEAIVLATS